MTNNQSDIIKISEDTSQKELIEIKKRITNSIKSIKAIRPTDRDVLSQLNRVAYQALDVFEKSQNKKELAAILDVISKHLMESNKFNKLDDISKMHVKGDARELLIRIHAITLFEGEMSIPSNISLKYLEDVFNIRKQQNKSLEERLIFDPATIRFIERLGQEFRIKNPEAYAKIVKSIIYNPIRNNHSVRTDNRVNGKEDLGNVPFRDLSSKKIFEILINYGETLRFLESKNKSNQMEIDQLMGVTKATFKDFLKYIEENDESYTNSLRKKLENLGSFEVHMPEKDITEYTSFQEFLAEANVQSITTVDPKTHIPQTREIKNHRKDPVGMTHDERFKAIQELIKEQRKTTPNLIVPTVFIGYKEPFKDYILFQFARESISDFEEIESKEIERDPIYGISISDFFGYGRSGCFKALTNTNVNTIFGSPINDQTSVIQGVSKRLDSYDIPGVLSVRHQMQNGFRYYVEMIDEAVNELRVAPQACFNSLLYDKISVITGTAPKKPIMQIVQHKNQTQAQTQKKATESSIDKFLGIESKKAKPKIDTDEYGYDKTGLNYEIIRKSVPFSSDTMKVQEKAREKMIDTLKTQYGYGRNPGLNLLDHCLEEMLVSGKNIVEITQELASREGYKDIPQAYEKTYAYVKNMIAVAVDNDPDYANEKIKVIYEREIKKLEEKSSSLDKEIDEKSKKLESIRQNTRKTLSHFNTTFEEKE